MPFCCSESILCVQDWTNQCLRVISSEEWKEYLQRIFHVDWLSPSSTLNDVWSDRETFPPAFLVFLTCPVCQSGEKQTWNLSKILHRQIFRLKILHRQFHLLSTVLVRKKQKMSEYGEIYTAGKNFTLLPAVTAWTNSTSGERRTKAALIALNSIWKAKEGANMEITLLL